MKKFNFRALLIVLLVLVLVVGLVACNKDKDKNNKNDDNGLLGNIEPKEFFTTMFDLAEDIGNQKVEKGGDVYINLDLDLAIGTKDSIENTELRSLKLGAQVEGVLDRTSKDAEDNPTSENTQLKVKLYAGSKNIVTLYYALKDPKTMYIDFGGQNIKMQLEVMKGTEVMNGKLAGWIVKQLGAKRVIKEATETTEEVTTTIDKVIDAVAGTTGQTFDLSSLITVIAKTFNLDLQSLLSQYIGVLAEADEMEAIFPKEGPKAGGIDLAAVLGIDALNQEFAANKDGNNYTVDIATNGVIGSALGGIIGCNDFGLRIAFEKDGDSMKDGVNIDLDLRDWVGDDAEKNSIYPYLHVGIKDIEIASGTNKSVLPTGAALTNYTGNVGLNVVETISLKNLGLVNLGNQETYDENVGTIEVGLKGKLDLYNKENNGTTAEAWISYKSNNATTSAEAAAQRVIEATYVNGRLAVKINRDVTFATQPMIDTLVRWFGKSAYNGLVDKFAKDNETVKKAFENFADKFFKNGSTGDMTEINDEFAGAVWDHFDFRGIVDGLTNMICEKVAEKAAQKAAGGATSAAEEGKIDIGDIFGRVQNVTREVLGNITKLGDGSLTVEATDVLEKVCKVANMALAKKKPADKGYWSVDGCIAEIIKFAGAEVEKVAKDNLPWSKTTGVEVVEEAMKLVYEHIDRATAGIVDIAANPKGETPYATHMLKQLLEHANAKVVLDLANAEKGVYWEVWGKLGNIELTYTSSINVFAWGNTTIADLASGITNENAESQHWFYADMTPAAAA